MMLKSFASTSSSAMHVCAFEFSPAICRSSANGSEVFRLSSHYAPKRHEIVKTKSKENEPEAG